MWQELKREGDEESVHLSDWSNVQAPSILSQIPILRIFPKYWDPNVLEQMATARALVSQALEARDKAKIKVRQPLRSLTIPQSASLSNEYLPLIADEVNVKKVVQGERLELDTALTDALREEGMARDIIREIQAFRKESDLQPKDRGTYRVQRSSSNSAFIEKHREYLQKETNTDIVFD